jgi:hypothetical protein
MNKKQTIRNFMAGFFLLVGVSAFTAPLTVSALGENGCETETAIIKCTNVKEDSKDIENTGLWSVLMLAINVLTAGVGVIALGGIVYGSVLYTSAGGNQEQVKKAIGIFTNVAIGVIAFAGMWALLNFLIPGGVFI